MINPLNQGADYDYLVIKKHNERPGVFEHKKGTYTKPLNRRSGSIRNLANNAFLRLVLKVIIILGKDLPNVSGDFIPAHGLMGIIKIEKKYFLIVVTDAEVVGTIKGSQIYRYRYYFLI